MSEKKELDNIKSLQGTNQILGNLEKAKEYIEELLDVSPDCYLVVTKKGKILKCNKTAGKILNINFEKGIYHSLFDIFSIESFNIMSDKFNIVEKTKVDVNFELMVSNENYPQNRILHWNLSILPRKNTDETFFVLSGRDITKIKEYEIKISEIFSCIPIGILFINKGGSVDPCYSKYIEYLLSIDFNDLNNKNYYDLIFKNSETSLSEDEIKVAKDLGNCIGQDEFLFDSVKKDFPIYLRLKNSNQNLVIRLSYHPLMLNKKVHQILLIIEDHTNLMANSHKN
jgi:PAS domain S-box-containing protein